MVTWVGLPSWESWRSRISPSNGRSRIRRRPRLDRWRGEVSSADPPTPPLPGASCRVASRWGKGILKFVVHAWAYSVMVKGGFVDGGLGGSMGTTSGILPLSPSKWEQGFGATPLAGWWARSVRPGQLYLYPISSATNIQRNTSCFALVFPPLCIKHSGELNATPRVGQEGGRDLSTACRPILRRLVRRCRRHR